MLKKLNFLVPQSINEISLSSEKIRRQSKNNIILNYLSLSYKLPEKTKSNEQNYEN